MFGTLFLLATQLFASLYFERFMTTHFYPELLLITLGLATSITIFYGEYLRQPWSWSLGTGFYVVSAANLTFLYWQVGNFWLYATTLVLALIGLLRSVGKMDTIDAWEEEYYQTQHPYGLETYSSASSEQVVSPDPVYVNFARDQEWTEAKTKKTTRTAKKSTRKKKN